MSSIGNTAQPAPTSQNVPYQNGVYTITAPNGQTYQVSSDQFSSVMGGQPPQQGGPVQMAGNVAGQQAGQSIVRGLSGGPASTPPPAAMNPGLGAQAFDPNLMTPANGTLPSGYSATEAQLGLGPSEAPYGYGVGADGLPASTAAAPAQAATPGMFAPGGAALQTGGIIAGAATGYEQAQGIKHVAQNKNMSPLEQAALFLPTFGGSVLYNPVKSFFGSTKDAAQKKRDSVRQSLKDGNLVDPNWDLTLPDGSKFNIGKDGHYKMDNGLHPYQVDFGQEGASDIVGAVNPLAALISKGDSKLTSDFAGYFTNALLNSKDKEQNIAGLYQQAGLTRDSALQMIADLKISDDKKAAYSSAVDTVFKGNKLQHADPSLVAAAPHFQNGVQQPSQAAPQPASASGVPVGQNKDPNVSKPPVNTSTVQKPVPPKGGALSLAGWQRPGMMANNPPGKKTLFGG